MSFECNFHGRKCMRVSKSLFSFIGYKPSSSRRMWFEGTFVRRRGGVLVLTTDVWLGVWPPATKATAPTDALQSPWLGWTFTWPATWPDEESGCQHRYVVRRTLRNFTCRLSRHRRRRTPTGTWWSCTSLGALAFWPHGPRRARAKHSHRNRANTHWLKKKSLCPNIYTTSKKME